MTGHATGVPSSRDMNDPQTRLKLYGPAAVQLAAEGEPTSPSQSPSQPPGSQVRPFLFHFHGMGDVDFSDLASADLDLVQEEAERRNWTITPTIYLRRNYLDALADVMHAYAEGRSQGRYSAIAGFAIEGPLLGPAGGIPPAGCWTPTVDEWRRIAELGRLGLRYMVMGPDAMELDDELEQGFTFRDLISALYDNGTVLAIGHFRRDHPDISARRTDAVIDFIQDRYGPAPQAIVTDHLFNDMPRNFVHAWRTPEEREHRDREVADFLATPWTDDNIDGVLGVVPATIIRAAKNGRLVPCLNFDGEHVDLDIQTRAARFIGPQRIIAITDNTETAVMAGEPLYRKPGNALHWRHDGLVAAGGLGIDAQIENMRSAGFSDAEIECMVSASANSFVQENDRMRSKMNSAEIGR
jgi:N-acetylglucosamine-6-phosphate deacetylase